MAIPADVYFILTSITPPVPACNPKVAPACVTVKVCVAIVSVPVRLCPTFGAAVNVLRILAIQREWEMPAPRPRTTRLLGGRDTAQGTRGRTAVLGSELDHPYAPVDQQRVQRRGVCAADHEPVALRVDAAIGQHGRAMTNASRIAGCCLNSASISPSSMR